MNDKVPAITPEHTNRRRMMENQQNPILKYFKYEHLPEHLQAISKPFGDLARHIHDSLEDGPEKSVALRKLLEAKDAAVRTAVK
jgi:hypothetical protein